MTRVLTELVKLLALEKSKKISSVVKAKTWAGAKYSVVKYWDRR